MPELIEILKKHQHTFFPVVPYNPASEKLIHLDLTKNNTELTEDIYNNTQKFSEYLNKKRRDNNAKFLIGGYNENRSLYKRSSLFDSESSKAFSKADLDVTSRTVHLGIDMWGDEGTEIFAPLGGMIHSFAFNNNFGDYGATLILSHQLNGISFYTLYGHLSLRDIALPREGQYVNRGQRFAHFGNEAENGHWPPHLHFQIINDIGIYEGDYPGVCSLDEREKYLSNCPDPELILNLGHNKISRQ
jgi:murein DD-endopeptidase MepM/ murein hydrolase activator NlpD